jgi:glucose-1-phosphate adenylyltransferase
VTVTDSLISDGCVIGKNSVIENSVIGVRAQIAENVTIRNSYIMGADSYENAKQIAANLRANRPDIGIGAGTRIEDAIIDKNARIGRNVRLLNESGVVEADDSPHYVIRDKIVVIPKFTIVPDGTVI